MLDLIESFLGGGREEEDGPTYRGGEKGGT